MDCKKLSNKKCENLAKRLAKYYGFILEKRIPAYVWRPDSWKWENTEWICLDFVNHTAHTWSELAYYWTYRQALNHLNEDIAGFVAYHDIDEKSLKNPLFPKDTSLEEIELTFNVKGY